MTSPSDRSHLLRRHLGPSSFLPLCRNHGPNVRAPHRKHTYLYAGVRLLGATPDDHRVDSGYSFRSAHSSSDLVTSMLMICMTSFTRARLLRLSAYRVTRLGRVFCAALILMFTVFSFVPRSTRLRCPTYSSAPPSLSCTAHRSGAAKPPHSIQTLARNSLRLVNYTLVMACKVLLAPS